LTPPGAGSLGSDQDVVVDRSWLPSARVTTVSIAPVCSVHVPATQITSTATGLVFGNERATDASASSHRLAGMPTHEMVGDAGGPLFVGAAQPEITMTARTARRRRSVVFTPGSG